MNAEMLQTSAFRFPGRPKEVEIAPSSSPIIGSANLEPIIRSRYKMDWAGSRPTRIGFLNATRAFA
jgi:hypothetical protein